MPFVRLCPSFECFRVHLLDGILALPVHDVDPLRDGLHERVPDLCEALLKSTGTPVLRAFLDSVRGEEKLRFSAGESARRRIFFPVRDPHDPPASLSVPKTIRITGFYHGLLAAIPE